MLYDFVDTQKLNYAGMVAMLEGLRKEETGGVGDGEGDFEKGGEGKTYGLGWFLGRDGERHCGIDEEDLLGPYRHGSDARAAVQTGAVGSWAVW